jgi:hypothetical protein
MLWNSDRSDVTKAFISSVSFSVDGTYFTSKTKPKPSKNPFNCSEVCVFQYAIKFFVEIIQGFASYNEASVLK